MAEDFTLDAHWLIEAGDDPNDLFRVWSGVGEFTFEGETWLGLTRASDGQMIATLSSAEVSEGSPSGRLTIQVSAANEALRAELLQDRGPVPVRILWIVSTNQGVDWTVVRRFSGRLGATSISSEDIWECEVETYSGSSVDRGRPLKWSDTSYRSRYPNNPSLDQMSSLAAGIGGVRFPS